MELPVNKQKHFSTSQALAVAVAAFERNQEKVVRDANGPEKLVPNREIIIGALNQTLDLEITDLHRAEADNIVSYLQQTNLMQTLTKGTSNQFLTKIAELIGDENISIRDIGILAWAPKLAHDQKKKDQVREVSARFEHQSNFVGKVGEKIIVNFSLIESRYIPNMNCYAVYGHDENGNLLFYWAKDNKKIIEVGRIQGKIKAHNKDKFRGNARVTNLNYVKVL